MSRLKAYCVASHVGLAASLTSLFGSVLSCPVFRCSWNIAGDGVVTAQELAVAAKLRGGAARQDALQRLHQHVGHQQPGRRDESDAVRQPRQVAARHARRLDAAVHGAGSQQ